MTARVSVAAMSAPQANLEGKQQRGNHEDKRDEFSYLGLAHGLSLLQHGWPVPSVSSCGQYADAAERSIRRMP